jgi:WD40 repeat protein
MRMLLAVGLLALVPLTAQAQATKDVDPVKVIKLERKDPVVYEKDIEPIFYKRCITCHSGNVKESRFDISSYEGLVKGGKRGTAIIPGKSDASLIYKVMGRTSKPFMPPPKDEAPCTPEELALVKLWIDQGAKAPTGQRERPKIVVSLPPASVHPVRALAVSPDKSAVAASRGNQIHIYDAGSGAYIRSLVNPDVKGPDGKAVKAAHMSLVDSMAYSPDGKWLVSGSFQEIAVWDILTGQLRQRVTGFAHAVVAVAFALDSKLFAVAGGEPTVEGEIKVFEVGSWRQVMDLKNGHSDTVYGVCFSPDNKMLATASADKFIKVWEVPSGKFVKSFEGHTHHVLDVGWMADGKLLASAGGDNTVKVWNFEKGEQERTINAHAKQVTRLLFVGKKSEFITGGGDSAVKKFNAANGGNIGNYGGATDFIYAIGASPDGLVIAAGGQEGIVRVYNGANAQLTRTLLPPDAQSSAPPVKK